MRYLVFDLECKVSPTDPGVGWKNYTAMGISVACAFLSWRDEYRFYLESELEQLIVDMAFADVISGFNILDFDFPLLKATMVKLGIRITNWEVLEAKAYDPMNCIRKATGMQIPRGWKLDNVAQSNLSIFKNGDGAMAPELWKKKQIGKLFSYVLRDVQVETALFRHCMTHRELDNKFTTPARTIRLVGAQEVAAKYNWDALPAAVTA